MKESSKKLMSEIALKQVANGTRKNLFQKDHPRLNNFGFEKGRTPWNKGKKNIISSERMKKNNPMKNADIRGKATHSLKEGYTSGRIKPSSGCFPKGHRPDKKCYIRKGITKPEKIMKGLIEKNNLPFNYVGNGRIILGGFNPDFLSKNPKHIIEVYGDYWHRNDKNHNRRINTYSKLGYKTLVIWEHELKNPLEVLSKIKLFINH